MGFPPSGTGVVHPLASLTPESRSAIERKIFGPVPIDEVAWWNKYRDILAVAYDRLVFEDPYEGEDSDSDSDSHSVPVLNSDSDKHWDLVYESVDENDFHPSQIERIDLKSRGIRVRKTPIDLTWEEVATLINSRTLPATQATESEGSKAHMRLTVKTNVIETYLYLICSYANEVRRAEQRRVNKIDKSQRSPDTSSQKFSGNNERGITDKIKKSKTRTSCKMIDINAFRTIEESYRKFESSAFYDAIQKVLNERQITRENFMNLDFLFIPHIDEVPGEDGHHYMLCGFAPRQRYMFVIDNSAFYPLYEEKYHINILMGMLNYLVPEESDRESWEINLDYSNQSDESQRMAVKQRDTYNCGVFAVTNALCLAFGYSLKCYKAREIDQFRKQRMVAELRSGGFKGLYSYDLIELPPPRDITGPAASYLVFQDDPLVDNFDPHMFYSGSSGDSTTDDEDSEESGTEESGGSDEILPKGDLGGDKEDAEDEDLEEARGLANTLAIDSVTVIQHLSVTLSTKKIFPTATECLALDITSDRIRPESLDRPMAAQFSAPTNRRFRIMYAFHHINFDEAIKCSKEEMIKACKKFPITNWERWLVQPKEHFLRWMMSEMGATMSKIHKDPIQPCPGFGDGYKIWLKWQLKDQDTKLEAAKEVVENMMKMMEVTQDEVLFTSVPFTSPRATKKRLIDVAEPAMIGAEDTIVVDTLAEPEKKKRRKRNSKARNYGYSK